MLTLKRCLLLAVPLVLATALAPAHADDYAGKSITRNQAEVAGGYRNGMAIFAIAKGGLMYQAVVAGQKFDYKSKP